MLVIYYRSIYLQNLLWWPHLFTEHNESLLSNWFSYLSAGKLFEIGTSGISSLTGHSEHRTACLNAFVEMYGHMPLVPSNVKAMNAHKTWFWWGISTRKRIICFLFLLLSSLLRNLPRGYTHTLHSSGLYYNPCDKMWVVFVYKKKREGFQLDRCRIFIHNIFFTKHIYWEELCAFFVVNLRVFFISEYICIYMCVYIYARTHTQHIPWRWYSNTSSHWMGIYEVGRNRQI